MHKLNNLKINLIVSKERADQIQDFYQKLLKKYEMIKLTGQKAKHHAVIKQNEVATFKKQLRDQQTRYLEKLSRAQGIKID